MLETTVGVLPQATGNDPLQVSGDVRAGRLRVLVDHGGQRGDARVAPKGAAARDHFIQDGAEREDIRACIGRLSLRLLGRHVGDRPDDLAFPGAHRHRPC